MNDVLNANIGLAWAKATGDAQPCSYLTSKKCGKMSLMCDSSYGCYPSTCNSSAPCCRTCEECDKCNEDAGAGKCTPGDCLPGGEDPSAKAYCDCKRKVCAQNDCSDLNMVGDKIMKCCGVNNSTDCELEFIKDSNGQGICTPTSVWTDAQKKELIDNLTKTGKLPPNVVTCVANSIIAQFSPSDILVDKPSDSVKQEVMSIMTKCSGGSGGGEYNPPSPEPNGPHFGFSWNNQNRNDLEMLIMREAPSGLSEDVKSSVASCAASKLSAHLSPIELKTPHGLKAIHDTIQACYGSKSGSGWTSIGAIIGYILAGLIVLGLMIFFIYWIRVRGGGRRRLLRF